MRSTPIIALVLFACGVETSTPPAINEADCPSTDGVSHDCTFGLKPCAGDPPQVGTACAIEWRTAGECVFERVSERAECLRTIPECGDLADGVDCLAACGRDLYFCGGTSATERECDDRVRDCKGSCPRYHGTC